MRQFGFANDFEINEDILSKKFFRPWLFDKDTDEWVGTEGLGSWENVDAHDLEEDDWNRLGETEDTCCPCCGCPCSPCFNGYEEDEEDSCSSMDDFDDWAEAIIGEPVEEVYIDNNLINPRKFEVHGLGEEKEGISYEDDTLYYAPLCDTTFKLFSFGIRDLLYQRQYVLRVHKEEIYKAYELACRLGELSILEDAVYLLYESVVLTVGLRYGNFLFGNLVKDFPDVMIPVMNKVFRVGGLIYIPIDGWFSQFEIDELLGGCHSTEDSDFYEVGRVSYLMGGFGFDFLKENGEFADYCPLVEVIEGLCENGLLIDAYWLTEALQYDSELIEELVELVFDWLISICGIESALKVANLLNAVCPLFSDLITDLKEIYCFGAN